MNQDRTLFSVAKPLLDSLLPWLTLLILLFYIYVDVAAPHIGFDFIPSTGYIRVVFADHSGFGLSAGDELYAVGEHLASEIRTNLRLVLFDNAQTGDILSLKIRREGEIHEVAWPVPGASRAEVVDRLFNVWWFAVVYWIAGAATLLLIRPKDTRHRLLAAFFMLTAFWLVTGNTARWGHWDARVLYRVGIWLFAPVCLHLHWVIPKPLARIPAPVLWGGYLVFALVAVLQWFESIHPDIHGAALAATLVVSIVLLLVHYAVQREERPRLRVLIFSFLFSALPLVGLSIAAAISAIPLQALVALVTLPIIPGAYFYSVYRHQLGALELRANRLISIYLLFLILGTLVVIFVAWVGAWPDFTGKLVSVNLAIALAAATIGIFFFPRFQRFVDRWLLAMPMPPEDLLPTYAARITTSMNSASLAQLLQENILPAMLIRQSALFAVREKRLVPVYAEGIPAQSPALGAAAHLIDGFSTESEPRLLPPFNGGSSNGDSASEGADERAGNAATSAPAPFDWVRLALPLRFEGNLIGLWLFGRRDPDDYYSQAEIATLQLLAHQTTLALVNITQSEHLQALYKSDVERHEAERRDLAHALHDEILGSLAVLYNNVDAAALTPAFEIAYDSLKQQIRRMISGLRPKLLDFGLYTALDNFVDDLYERSDGSIDFQFEVAGADVRLPEAVEEHIFRIVQQACENALRHAQANTIRIAGRITEEEVQLEVIDDGIGFDAGEEAYLPRLLAQRHFGLAGMVERAAGIDATVEIQSTPAAGGVPEPGSGTRVCVTWRAQPVT